MFFPCTQIDPLKLNIYQTLIICITLVVLIWRLRHASLHYETSHLMKYGATSSLHFFDVRVCIDLDTHAQ